MSYLRSSIHYRIAFFQFNFASLIQVYCVCCAKKIVDCCSNFSSSKTEVIIYIYIKDTSVVCATYFQCVHAKLDRILVECLCILHIYILFHNGNKSQPSVLFIIGGNIGVLFFKLQQTRYTEKERKKNQMKQTNKP